MHAHDHVRSRKSALTRKVLGCIIASAFAVALGAGTAFATDNTSTHYSLPKANEVIAFEHQGNDNGADYTYQYVTIGSSATGRVAPMMQTYYEVLGLNYINAYRGPDSIFTDAAAKTINTQYTGGSVGDLTTVNSTLAIMGSSNNENADEYIWNYCAWANGGAVAADQMAVDHGSPTTGAVSVTIGGTEYADFPREVYMECNLIASASETATYGTLTWLQWVELENQRENRPKSAPYNPYFVTYGVQSGGAATMVRGLHTLADTIDSIVAQSKDANGNYTLQTRYGGNRPDGTGANIDKYEDLVKATEYYTISKIANGTVEKAVSATLVGYDPATGNYACRKFDTKHDPDGNQYGGRVANYLHSITTNITDLGLEEAQEAFSEDEAAVIAWYTPEQIVEFADVGFVCDAYSANAVSTYLATSTSGAPFTVYTPPEVSRAEEDNTGGLVAARNAALAEGKHACNFCFSYPANMFGNFYAQGVENGMLSLICCSFTYPELFNLTDMLGYWAKYVWHIKDSALQSVVTGTCSSMSLVGQEIGTISANYEAEAEKVFNAGNRYYLDHIVEINALNSGNLRTFDVENLLARTDTNSIEVPIAKTGLVYNGLEQVGVPAIAGCTIEQGVGTNPGEYKATATLNSADYVWSDGTTEPKVYTWSIERNPFQWVRLAGSNRYGTMSKIATTAFASNEYAIVATGRNYADALSASALAGAYDAPIILTKPAELPQEASSALTSLGVRNVIIMGGEAAVSTEVENAIKALNIATERLAGSNRQETSLLSMRKVAERTGGQPATVIVATGYNFADALSISPYAYATKSPILLTKKDRELNADEVTAIKNAKASVVVVGGDAAVNAAAVNAAVGADSTVLAGGNRYLTSAAIADFELSQGMSFGVTAVATGTNYPDALTGGVLCGKANGILLLAKDPSSETVKATIPANKFNLSVGYVLGGENAVSAQTMAACEAATA